MSSSTDQEILDLMAQVAALQLEQMRPRPALPDVDKYDGLDYHKFRIFMADINEKIAMDCEALGGDKGCLVYISSRLTGDAKESIGPHMESFYTMKDPKKALLALLEQTFNDPAAQDRAHEDLHKLELEDLSIREYLALADRLMVRAN
ncbi:hypothetical protein Cpir12675_006114 [Ceratocystis pirilliformis]|uniref:Uncharacterized protein n=1 Tax=Ceratocystis pirilliformis TaxID=259994 RepID=A0ABR3YK95_9PEZI